MAYPLVRHHESLLLSQNTSMRTLLTLVSLSLCSLLFCQTRIGQELFGSMQSDQFGSSVAISYNGSRIICSSEAEGYVRVFEYTGNNWTQLGPDFVAEDFGDKFGSAIAISQDGHRIAIGASDEDGPVFELFGAGIVRVFEWVNDEWVQLGSNIIGEEQFEHSGSSLSFSSDSNILAIGAPDYNGDGFDNGKVKIYQWADDDWMQLGNDINTTLDQVHLGYAVSLSADGMRVAIAALGFEWNETEEGFVQVYEWDGSNWAQLGNGIFGYNLDFGFSEHYSVDISANGNRVVIGTPGFEGGIVRVFDWDGVSWAPAGKDIQRTTSSIGNYGHAVSITADGNRIICSNPSDAVVYVFDWYSGQWWSLFRHGIRDNEEQFPNNFGEVAAISGDGNTVIIGNRSFDGTASSQGKINTYVLDDIFLQGGKVVFDDLLNCEADADELGPSGIPIICEGDEESYITFTNPNGEYTITLPPGEYAAFIDDTEFPYHEVCPEEQPITVVEQVLGQSIDQTNFTLQSTVDCPYLLTEISTPFIRRCFQNQYQISYCNQGSIAATDAYIEVTLDQHLTYLGSSVPLSNQNDNLLVFDIGTVEVGQCGEFTLDFIENCESELGQIHCTSIRIFPDTVCYPDIPLLLVDENCDGSLLNYSVTNRSGDLDMPLPYYLLDNNGIVDTGSIIVPPNETVTISYDTGGSEDMYQFVLSPDDQAYQIATGLKGCNENANSFDMHYLAKSLLPFKNTDCIPNIGSYDPNDKTAQPVGVGNENAIPPKTDLEYLIRFQNTGTDTAFTVKVVDTLSHFLNSSSLRVLAASHLFEVEFVDQSVDGEDVILFTFNDILLPDSTTNQEASNGWIKFSVELEDELEESTLIENKAAIYFDFNLPIITNTVHHIIRTPDVILTSLDREWQTLPVQLHPNPTSGDIFIDLNTVYKKIQVTLRTPLGQTIFRQEFYQERRIPLKIATNPGIYFLELQTEEGRALVKILKH